MLVMETAEELQRQLDKVYEFLHAWQDWALKELRDRNLYRNCLPDDGKAREYLSSIMEPPAEEPETPGKKVNVNGRLDEARGIEYLGDAHEMTDGTWRCLANVRGMLCRVQVSITEEKSDG